MELPGGRGLQNSLGEVVRKNRVKEHGRIFKILPQPFCISFEAAPVWLLAFSKENTTFIYLCDFKSFTHFNTYLNENKINTGFYHSKLQSLGSDKVVFGSPPDDTVHLLSGSIPFLNEKSILI